MNENEKNQVRNYIKYLKQNFNLKIKNLEEKHQVEINAKIEMINIYKEELESYKNLVKILASRSIEVKQINQNQSGDGDNVGNDKNVNES
jgi:tRNA isopentenyl-2-thiomethyl-A-37 hydroxylase MiaE